MNIFIPDVNWSKDSLVEYAIQKMGISGTAAKAMSKHNLIVSVFIKRCFNNNRYVGDYGWIRQTVVFLKKKAREKGLNIGGMCGKQELLNKLFTHAYNTTTIERSLYLKPLFLREYERLTSKSLQVVQRNFQYQYTLESTSQAVNIYGEDTVVDQNNSAELMKELTCVVCITNKRAIMFSDCGHFATCNECTKRLEKKCPICRLKNVNIRKIFL